MKELINYISTFTLLVGAVVALILKIINGKKQIEESIPIKVKNQSNINIAIINKMEFLKEYLKADRIQIYDFHNGGHYANGRSALKVSNTYEVVRAGVKPCQKELQAIPISIIPVFIDTLLTNHKLDVKDIENVKDLMPSTYAFKKSQDIKSFYDVVITNSAKEPIGFIGIQYVNGTHKEYTEEELNEILKMKFFVEDNLDKMIDGKK